MWCCSILVGAVAASFCKVGIHPFETARECIWIQNLLDCIRHPHIVPTIVLHKNATTKSISDDPLLHYQVKHVNMKYHFWWEHALSEDLHLSYINTKDNIGDMFTMALDVKQFMWLCYLGLKWWILDGHCRYTSLMCHWCIVKLLKMVMSHFFVLFIAFFWCVCG